MPTKNHFRKDQLEQNIIILQNLAVHCKSINTTPYAHIFCLLPKSKTKNKKKTEHSEHKQKASFTTLTEKIVF